VSRPLENVRAAIRDVPDFPKTGILFKDITPVLNDPALFRACIEHFAARHRGSAVKKIAAIESRGFIFGAALADRLGVGFVPIRKKGKLPHKTAEATYALEYGTATIEAHLDSFAPGEAVLLIDDVLATGGTALAAAGLVERLGARVVEIDFLIELSFLNGREKLAAWPLHAPIAF
jgi:adenine phosphoribosyltransferase